MFIFSMPHVQVYVCVHRVAVRDEAVAVFGFLACAFGGFGHTTCGALTGGLRLVVALLQLALPAGERGAVDAREWAAMNQTNPNYYYDQFGNIRFKPGYDPRKGSTLDSSASVASLMKTYTETYGLTPKEAAALVTAQLRGRSAIGVSNPIDDIWG